MGVDRVIAVDLERPGTGSGGAFLGPDVPVETLLTTNIFAEYMAERILGKDKSHPRGVTVISVRGKNCLNLFSGLLALGGYSARTG